MNEKMPKISISGKALISIATTLVGSYYAINYYKDATCQDAKSRAKAISQFMVHKKYESVRLKDVQIIRQQLILKPEEIRNKFSVLIGPRGIGKTVAIETAAENLKGILFEPIKFFNNTNELLFEGIITIGPVQPGTSQDEIMNAVCAEITSREGSYSSNKEFMKKVVDAYHSQTGKVPVIIIQASQRPLNKEPAELSAAARVLVDKFGLNVFIDCSENAFPDNPKTGREFMIVLEPMSWDMMRELPDFKNLSKMLKTQNNEEIVLAVCGGAPLLLSDLNYLINFR